MLEFKKRVVTSFFLFILLILMHQYTYVLIIALIIITVIAWVEVYGLLLKIFKKNNIKHKLLRFFYKSLSLLYLSFLFLSIVIIFVSKPELKIFIIFSLFISIASDTGGLFFGKIFKGKKLTKISPKKTISGSIGAFIFSLSLIPFFNQSLVNYKFTEIFLYVMIISLISQTGDLFISFLKRKARVKNTSNILPGHGGLLDRVDGIIFTIPSGIIFGKYLLSI